MSRNKIQTAKRDKYKAGLGATLCGRCAPQSLRQIVMLSRTLLLFSFAVLCIAVIPRCARAQAGPPLLTDDPETPDKGHWEINLVLTLRQTRDGRLFGAPLVDANYGLAERVQIKAEVPWLVRQDRNGGRTQSGIGSTNIGIKWRFIDKERHGFSMSIYPQLEFRLSAASVRKGLIESGAELRLPVEISRKYGKFAIDGEVGYQIVQRGKDEWIYGLAIERKVNKRLELVGEVHGESTRDLNDNKIVFNVGGRCELSKRYTILFSSGRGLRHASGDVPTWIAYTGLQLHF